MKTCPWSISVQNFTCFGLTNYYHEIWIPNSYAQQAFIHYHNCPNESVLFCHHTKLGNIMIINVWFSTCKVKIKVFWNEMPYNLMVPMLCDFLSVKTVSGANIPKYTALQPRTRQSSQWLMWKSKLLHDRAWRQASITEVFVRLVKALAIYKTVIMEITPLHVFVLLSCYSPVLS
jgi:hypothetical protein